MQLDGEGHHPALPTEWGKVKVLVDSRHLWLCIKRFYYGSKD